MLKVGDKVVVFAHSRNGTGQPSRIVEVIGFEGTVAKGRCVEGVPSPRSKAGVEMLIGADEPAPPAELAAAEAYFAEQAQRQRAKTMERERKELVRSLDPRTPFIDRLKSGEWEPWDRLTLEQLQQIVAWLDAAKAAVKEEEQE